MKKIFLTASVLIMAGCQSQQQTANNQSTFTSMGSTTYQDKRYFTDYAKIDDHHFLIKVRPGEDQFFPVNEASKNEAAAVALRVGRTSVCRSGDVKVNKIIEVDRIRNGQNQEMTRYIATIECE